MRPAIRLRLNFRRNRWIGWALLLIPLWAQAERPSLIAPGASLTKVASGFTFTEGSRVDRDGNLYFTDIPNNRIHKLSPDGKITVFREKSGGANGLGFDRQGRLLACEGDNRRVTMTDKDGRITVLAERYQGKKLNSPNDLWVDPKGGIYFTDPHYGSGEGLEQGGFHVYYLTPDRKRLLRVTEDLVNPNGIIGTPDGKRLYVADHGGKNTFVYTIEHDGTLSGKKLFAPQGSDGMTRDEQGNLYLTGEEVSIYNLQGKRIQVIKMPEVPSNLCFGGQDRRTLFITARNSLYSIRMNVRGQ